MERFNEVQNFKIAAKPLLLVGIKTNFTGILYVHALFNSLFENSVITFFFCINIITYDEPNGCITDEF